MSFCGGGTGAVNVNLTFDDAATATVNPSVTGTYKPTQCSTSTFSPPAPAAPYGTTLAALNGGAANGVWKLFVQDFATIDSGNIAGGWTLTITSAPAAPMPQTFTVNTNLDNESNGCATGNCTLREAVAAANANSGNDTINFDPTFFAAAQTITLDSSEIAITNNGSLTINGTGANLLTINGGTGDNRIFYSDAATFTLSGVTLTSGNGAGAVFSGRGGAVGDNSDIGAFEAQMVLNSAPVISEIADLSTPENTSTGGISFTVTDAENQGTLTVTATSSNQMLVPDANIMLMNSGSSYSISLQPVANQSGTTTITVTATDGTLTDTETFILTVTAVPPTVSTIADNDADNIVIVNQTVTYTVTFNEAVTGVEATDFINTGTSAMTVIAVSPSAQTSAESFTVVVKATTVGSMILSVRGAATIADAGTNQFGAQQTDDDALTVQPSRRTGTPRP